MRRWLDAACMGAVSAGRFSQGDQCVQGVTAEDQALQVIAIEALMHYCEMRAIRNARKPNRQLALLPSFALASPLLCSNPFYSLICVLGHRLNPLLGCSTHWESEFWPRSSLGQQGAAPLPMAITRPLPWVHPRGSMSSGKANTRHAHTSGHGKGITPYLDVGRGANIYVLAVQWLDANH